VKKEEWITAAEALRLLRPVFGEYDAKLTICKRAHAGLIRARTKRYMIDDNSAGAQKIPKEFWWEEGHSKLEQNWVSGDFATRIEGTRHGAFGVSFSRADIERLIPVPASPVPKPDRETGHGGKWDAFISHASEDKDFVLPLVKSLERSGLNVWYDDDRLIVGDSLLQSIDYGLANSQYGIVVISPNFLKKVWPKRELDGLVAREAKILPVWHNIDADEVRRNFPTLAGLVAVRSEKGPDEVTRQLMRKIGQSTAKPSIVTDD
jgi:TIR domain